MTPTATTTATIALFADVVDLGWQGILMYIGVITAIFILVIARKAIYKVARQIFKV